MNPLLLKVPGSETFRWADVAWILAIGAGIHYIATAAFWLPQVAQGCAIL